MLPSLPAANHCQCNDRTQDHGGLCAHAAAPPPVLTNQLSSQRPQLSQVLALVSQPRYAQLMYLVPALHVEERRQAGRMRNAC